MEALTGPKGLARKRCTRCGWTWYNNPLAVVLVLGEAGDGRILYTRKSTWPKGMWALVAGFIEDGETPEEAAIREVREEAGIEAADPRYVGSQVLSGQLLLCFHVRLLDGHPVSGSDADAVMLAEPDPNLIPEGAPARRLVEQFLAGNLPIRQPRET